MTKFFCDRCGQEGNQVLGHAQNITIEIRVAHWGPYDLCQGCIDGLKAYLNEGNK